MWVVLMVLASCQNGAEDPGLTEAVPAQSDYPSLHTVPPRPQLSYTVEQRRAIVDGLIADRENARYSNQVVRYRTGLSGLPPPATPPVAAAPPTAAPDVATAGEVSPVPDRARDLPPAAPETEFDHYDDDLDSFLEDMAGEGTEPAAAAPGPESHVAPVGREVVRAGAGRPVAPPVVAYDGPAPAAVWATPTKTTSLPTAASAAGTREARSAPARVETSLAGRAPGVVWGMVDMSDRPARPTAAAEVAQGAGASTATASSPAPMPAAAAPADRPEGGAGRPSTEVTLAGRAPGVVWGMVDMPDRPAEPAPATNAAPAEANASAASPAASPEALAPAPAMPIETGHQNATADGDGQAIAPAAVAMAERPARELPFETPGDAAGIEIHDGLIAVSLAPSAGHPAPLASIGFAPGSAVLPPHATTHLERFLAAVNAPEVRIRVVGEADTPALALDRALAVGLALVQRGVPADRLDLTLAPDPGSDQVRLSAVASAP
jgi:outer membrane protein OmpA-like peptidoglycan-associated protein